MSDGSALRLAISARQRGTVGSQALLWTLLASDLLVASAAMPPDRFEDADPLIVSREGSRFLAVFTSPDRAESFGGNATYLQSAPGVAIVRALPADAGLAVDPGSDAGFEVPAAGIAVLRAEAGL